VTDAPIQLIVEEPIARITIDRPEKRNALSVEMRQAFADAVDGLTHNAGVRAVLLTGTGRDFCAGADLEKFVKEGPAASRTRMQRGGHRLVRGLHGLEKPVIAAVQGNTIGLGWSIALACDMVIAADTARFAMTHRKVGLVPDGGAVYFLARQLGLLRAKELIYSARTVSAAEALSLGLVTRVVPEADLAATATDVARELAAGPSFALGLTKKLFHAAHAPTLEEFLETESLVSPQLRFTADFLEGIAAFREKRPPNFTGS
jgi:2-(1,2-epoxy-1,2-dihydrophenyl)acetyl-CoA isomerase